MHADTARIVNEEHMRLFRGSQRMLLAAALAGAVSLLGAASALANFPLVSGQLSCTSQGQQLITWTVANSDTSGVGGNTMRIDAVSVSQGTVAGIFVGQVVQPQPLAGSSVTGTTTLTNATGMVTLTVTGHFFTAGCADTGLVDTESATVFLSLNCAPQTQTQTIAGHIYDCTGGTATTTEVPGGTLGAGGPQSVATQGDPLTPTQVVAGTYTMSAGSPSGYQLVVCGSTATVTSPSTATESVNVPSGGAGVGIFYVTKITQTIAGHIYDCTGGTATTTEVPGGTLGAGGPQSVATQGNPLTPTQVVAGTYTMSAGSPSGYQLVVCGSTATVTSPSTATESVNVPSGGAGVGIFYVTKITQTIAGHIYDCTGGTATTTEVPGGTLGAGGPQSVATQGNPLTPTQVVAGTYTMSAGSPSGYQLVVCGSTATVTSPSTATESVNVPSGGAGVGIFYVTKITPLGTPLGPGMTATIGFWHNQNGQALIDSLNGGPNSTALGTWLATNFPNLFGGSCANLAGKTNAQVAAAFLVDFNLHGSAKQDTAQFFAVALASYSTSTSLAGGNQAAAYGFTTSSAGSGAATFNVGTNGAAFGVPNDTTLTLMQLLQDANSLASNCGTSDAAAGVFDSINSIGDIS